MSTSGILLEVTAVLTLALAGSHVLRRNRAAVRHVLLAGAFGVLLILPFASMLAPSVSVEVPAAVYAIIAPLAVDQAAVDPISSASVTTIVAPELTAPSSAPSRASVSTLLITAWIAGTTVFLLPVVVGLWQVRSLRRSGLPWRDGVTTITVPAKSGFHRPIEVLRHESIPGPMTCGLIRPAIMLPMDAESWAREDLQRAIVHELEHVRRADWLTHCLARVVAAGYWFHPLVWVARRQLALEAERACDDAVLRDSEATAYADQLVVFARRLSTGSGRPQLAMANRRDLATRVRAVLDGAQRRGRAGAMWVGAAVAVCGLLVMAMSPLRIVAAASIERAPIQSTPAQSVKFDVVSIKPCSGETPPQPAAPAPSGGRSSGAAPWIAQTSPGHVRWNCVTLATLIDQAYADRDHPLLNMRGDSRPPPPDPRLSRDHPKRVRGGPSWVETDTFTIEAKAPVDLTTPALQGRPAQNLVALPATMSQALRAVLEERFQVKVRRLTEQQDMYALTVAKSGLNKERIKPTSPTECVTSAEYFAADAASRANLKICGRYFVTMPAWQFTGFTLQQLAREVSGMTTLFVLDRTGVDGTFTFDLDFAGVDPAVRGDDRFIQALERLGLRIDRTKGTAEYLQIDSAQRPRPDAPAALTEVPARAGSRR